jgi:hypothetical protein
MSNYREIWEELGKMSDERVAELETARGRVVATTTFDPPIQCDADTEITITYEVRQLMPNESNRRNLKAQMDLLSDAHADITAQAAHCNTRIIVADEQNTAKPGHGSTSLKWAGRQLESLEALLEQQRLRVLRVAAEVKAIRENLKTI